MRVLLGLLLSVVMIADAAAEDGALRIEFETLGERPAELSVARPYEEFLSESLGRTFSAFLNARSCDRVVVRSVVFADVSDTDEVTRRLTQHGGRVFNEVLHGDMCGAQYMPNYYILAAPGSPLELVEGVPGQSLANLQLELDVKPQVLRVARILAQCPEPNVVGVAHTAIDRAPPEGGGAWEETWIVSACSARVEIPLRFQPSPRGGTDYAINGSAARVTR